MTTTRGHGGPPPEVTTRETAQGTGTARDIVRAARDLAGYDRVSGIRQAQDHDWVLSQALRPPERLADLGCGTGVLLAEALDRWPGVRRALGVDGSPARVQEAAARLGDRAEVLGADIRRLADRPESFDLITMTSVLHWLYPDEENAFAWVERHLAEDGVFVLTTHHPDTGADGLGAEDLVVADALEALGASGEALRGVTPMGVRARPVEAVKELLERHLTIQACERKRVAFRTSGADEYERFHAATFGTYFSQALPHALEGAFFRAVGEAAARRMARQGEIYSLTVCAWRAVPGASR